jgi:hypothetical protein
MSATSFRMGARDPREQLRLLGLPMLGLLGVELLLGMSLNLFTTLPTGSVESVLLSNPVLIVHVLIGVLLIGTMARAVALARRADSRRVLGVASLGLVSVLVAFLAGVSFAFVSQTAASSYFMTVGFTGAFLSVGFLVLAKEGSAAVPRSGRVSRAAPSSEVNP